jgi:limonene-1,2-epoxide hydrolase
LDVLFDTSRQIDATHGTDITTALWENVVNGTSGDEFTFAVHRRSADGQESVYC